MHRKAVLALILLAVAAMPGAAQPNPNALTPKEKAEGWKLLFDGTSMDGWRGYRQTGIPASW